MSDNQTLPEHKGGAQGRGHVHGHEQINRQHGSAIGIDLASVVEDVDRKNVDQSALDAEQKQQYPGEPAVPRLGHQIRDDIDQRRARSPDQCNNIGFTDKIHQVQGQNMPEMDEYEGKHIQNKAGGNGVEHEVEHFFLI